MAAKQPTPSAYLTRLTSDFGGRSIPLTQKVHESLFHAIQLARTHDTFVSEEAIIAGLLDARSTLLPLLDAMEVELPRYRQNLERLLPHDDGTFGLDFDFLLDRSRSELVAPFRVLRLANLIGTTRQAQAIDSGLLLEALLRDHFYSGFDIGDEMLTALLGKPLSSQIGDYLNSPLEDLASEDIEDDLIEDDLDDEIRQVFRILSKGNTVPYLPWAENLESMRSFERSLRLTNIVEPYIDNVKLSISSVKNRLIVRQYDYLNTYLYDAPGQLMPIKVGTITGGGLITWQDIEEFEYLLNNPNASEGNYQKFFETHKRFLLGSDYRDLHSHISLITEDGKSLVPDFFAESIGSNFADIIELKKPSAKLVSSSGGYQGFAKALTYVLNQLRDYRNFFDNSANRSEFHRLHHFEAFRPSITVVIGRSLDYTSQIQRRAIEDEYKNLKVMTYDDVLRRAKQMAVMV